MPECDLACLSVRICALGIALTLGTAGCADRIGSCDTDCDRGDAAGLASDAGLDATAPSSQEGGMPPPAPDAAVEDPDTRDSEDFSGDLGTCSDGRDNNGSGGVDCDDDAACGWHRYCCVGSTEASCCTPGPSGVELAFSTCSDLSACAQVDGVFGTPGPTLEAGRFVPNATLDSGVVLEGSFDARRDHISMTARIVAPLEPCPTCMDVILFGLGDAPQEGAARVLPDVAVAVRRAHGDLALLVGGEVIAETELEAGTTFDCALHLSPSGELSVDVGTRLAALRGTWSPTAGRRPLLLGRTPELTQSTTHLAVESVRLETRACDAPGAFVRDPAPLPLEGGAPSVVRDGARVVMAVHRPDGLHLFRSPDGLAPFTPIAQSPSLADDRLSDPALLATAAGLVLYATRSMPEGPELVRFEATDDVFGDAEVLSAQGKLRHPSVVLYRGRTLLAATDTERGRIALFDSADGRTFARLGEVAEPGPDYSYFDDDAVAEPALAVDGQDLLRLYYAGRRGTRWAIGVRVSDGGMTWRDPLGPGVAALVPSGLGHDALGVRAPSVWIDGTRVHLHHVASDGLREVLAHAEGATR